MAKAKGYAKIRQRIVAMAAREILLTSAGIYFTACSAHLNTYLKIIDGIDLTDSHLLPTIKLLFEDANIPKDLA